MKANKVSALRSKRGLHRVNGAEPPVVGLAPQTTNDRKADTMKTRSEEHTSELQSPCKLVCRLLLAKNRMPDVVLAARAAVIPPRQVHVIGVGVRCKDVPEVIAKFIAFFFFNDTATTEIYTLSLHDALSI